MRYIPLKVLRTFEHMKGKEPPHIELKNIKNNHSVYRATSEWDNERKKAMPSSWSCEPTDNAVILTYDSIACA